MRGSGGLVDGTLAAAMTGDEMTADLDSGLRRNDNTMRGTLALASAVSEGEGLCAPQDRAIIWTKQY